ncbi:MAG TPA: type II toxin-antitoxin system VapC family toxin [Hanamia sp.]|nr:type II toxin-antitoxin system VapC family toxin [Hanamia sp.]
MTGNNYLLDSNIVIEIFNGNTIFADKISDEEVLYLPCIVLGELYTGVNRVVDKPKHLKMLTDFLKFCTIVNIDGITAKYYGEMIASLHKKGKPIPTNDVWIAAIALQHGLTLITNDKHFKEVPELKMINWQKR